MPLLSAAVNPLIPSGWEIVLWILSLVVLALVVTAVVSLMRSPLDPHRQLSWVIVIFLLPGLGAGIWLWWRHWYYPRRRAESPDWDPNDRTVTINAPRRLIRTDEPPRR